MIEAHPNPESPSQPPPTRRGFFEKLLLWTTYAAGAVAAAAVGLPFIGFLLGPVRKSPEMWVPLGPTGQFPEGETRLAAFTSPLGQPWDGKAAHTGVYVRCLDKDKQQFVIFAMNCAHLGCPVSWFPQSGLFMCPCHGGVYYESGEVASGPPPRGLFQCVWRVRDGGLEVQAPHYPTLQDTLKPEARS
jgi:Rieske Fe-S protein